MTFKKVRGRAGICSIQFKMSDGKVSPTITSNSDKPMIEHKINLQNEDVALIKGASDETGARVIKIRLFDKNEELIESFNPQRVGTRYE